MSRFACKQPDNRPQGREASGPDCTPDATMKKIVRVRVRFVNSCVDMSAESGDRRTTPLSKSIKVKVMQVPVPRPMFAAHAISGIRLDESRHKVELSPDFLANTDGEQLFRSAASSMVEGRSGPGASTSS
jgi:hypothetical protein